MSIGSHVERGAPRECYLGAQRDLAGIQAPFDPEIRNDPQGGASWVFFPIALIDLPLSFALDTVLLPYDIVRCSTPPKAKPIKPPVPPTPGREVSEPIPLVWIEPGTFTMGPGRRGGEPGGPVTPPRRVTISRGFWMGSREVTQAEYGRVVETASQSYFRGNLHFPVDSVTWLEALTFCRQLTEQERLAGRLPGGYAYRLPTEAEWEYACRAGSLHRFPWGDEADPKRLKALAWFDANVCTVKEPSGRSARDASGRYGRTQSVGRKEPNAWGLHDMHGNVWEWCLDAWAERLAAGDFTDPLEAAPGLERVDRGGAWDSRATDCASDSRVGFGASQQSAMQGFRVVLAPTP